MTDFKIGDRVRLTGRLWYSETEWGGNVKSIEGFDREGAYFTDHFGHPWYIYQDEYLSQYWGCYLVDEDMEELLRRPAALIAQIRDSQAQIELALQEIERNFLAEN